MKKELKYKLLTYGCQMNEYDSEVIASVIESMGGTPTNKEEESDLIIFNTCCVRNNADMKVYGRIGQYKAIKKKNPNLVIIVCGCLAQKDKDNLIKKFPYINLVLGTHNLKDLKNLIKEIKNKKQIVKADEEGSEFLNPIFRKDGITGYIPISIGCDCFCTYCIVPYVRGRIKSRPFNDVINEAKKLVKQGFKEIFLLGQNVNTYGHDLNKKTTFTKLLQAVNDIEGIGRIRFTSPHPKDFSEELITNLGNMKNVCESIHLPLQAGSNSTLKRMNRKYNTEQFLKIVKGLRTSIPNVAISTDLIVGFPGETEEDFQEGLEFIRKIQFDQAFMFAYSIRGGTAAANMPGHLAKEIKMKRLYRLIEMQNDITRKKNEQEIGNEVEILIERISKKNESRVTGRTRKNKVVNVNGNKSMIGKIYKTKIEKAYTWGFIGSSPY